MNLILVPDVISPLTPCEIIEVSADFGEAHVRRELARLDAEAVTKTIQRVKDRKRRTPERLIAPGSRPEKIDLAVLRSRNNLD